MQIHDIGAAAAIAAGRLKVAPDDAERGNGTARAWGTPRSRRLGA